MKRIYGCVILLALFFLIANNSVTQKKNKVPKEKNRGAYLMVHFKDLGHFNEGAMKATNFSSPKHPVVIQITKKEALKLDKKWNLILNFKKHDTKHY